MELKLAQRTISGRLSSQVRVLGVTPHAFLGFNSDCLGLLHSCGANCVLHLINKLFSLLLQTCGVIKLTVNCFRSPFGLCVSPAAAQRLNQHVFLVVIVTVWGQEGFTSWCLGFIELQARKVNFKTAYFGHNSNKNVYVWLQWWGQVSARYRVAVGRGETI